MSYTVQFSRTTAPQIFQAVSNAATWLSKHYKTNYDKVVILPTFEQEFNLKLSEIKSDDTTTSYTATFESERDYICFVLRWA